MSDITNRKNMVNVFRIMRSRPGKSSNEKNVRGAIAINLSISCFAHLLRNHLTKKEKKITKTIIITFITNAGMFSVFDR